MVMIRNLHNSPQLSKSRFIAGLQCLKRLYLECYNRELADPIDPARQRIFDTGHAIGELARQRFPGGVLIEEPYYEHAQAVRTTNELLSATPVPPLYEAAFTFERIRIRVDVLQQNHSGFDLVEVKSSTRLRLEHIADAAIQLYVVEGSGIPVNAAYVMHVNRAYSRKRSHVDPERMFSIEDVTTGQARAFIASSVPENLARMWESLKRDSMPDIKVGSHCERPYRCPFYGHCHQD